MNRILLCGRRAFVACLLLVGSCAADGEENSNSGGSNQICENSCSTANDGDCDDGGDGADFDVCELGTDCGDCGPREIEQGGGGNNNTPDAGDQGGGGNSDNGGPGDPCSCDEGHGPSGTYMICAGTEDGCEGFGGTGSLQCVSGQPGSGVCSYRCNSSDAGTQGDCPAGYTCLDSGYETISGSNWYLCY